MLIREMSADELERVVQLKPPAWSDIKPYFGIYLRQPSCMPFVAVEDGEIVGVANGSRQGDVGWLGHVIVSPAYRGRGIGKRLVLFMIDRMKQSGCRTIALIASKDGEPLYRKLGFREADQYVFFSNEEPAGAPRQEGIRLAEAADYEAVLQLDRDATGEDRSYLLDEHRDRLWVVGEKGSPRGYYAPQLGNGAVVAADEEAGSLLLHYKHSLNGTRSVIPEANEAASRILSRWCVRHEETLARMVLGADIAWKPERIYCRIHGSFG
ncbi:GNAT family N-acetyltransferase [Paenibacillus sp. MSJ-34]|uniref:GNAT family N-acetyltransferase n=1 Tax=Paenibacillus sp. MSJ-34 TaxID=2841529 RepID=UPI001C1255E6|nr:GNAT family N-acetyltransferase [Paenibacillus sp. MSJ-34]MBU5445319.1 GNAT family N-acetyltransferase [Paenibacillus sp. MSJ-34]